MEQTLGPHGLFKDISALLGLMAIYFFSCFLEII